MSNIEKTAEADRLFSSLVFVFEDLKRIVREDAPPPSVSPVVVPGRPPNAHPWRRTIATPAPMSPRAAPEKRALNDMLADAARNTATLPVIEPKPKMAYRPPKPAKPDKMCNCGSRDIFRASRLQGVSRVWCEDCWKSAK